MLEHALKVVEAARELRLVTRNGRTASELGQLDLAKTIDRLRLALETFDAETSRAGTESLDPKHKPDYAVPPQMADEPALVPHGKGFKPFTPNVGPASDVEADEPGELKPEARVLPKPVLAAAALAALSGTVAPAPSPSPGNHDLGDDGVFFDGDETAADLLLAMDAINDKLAFAVAKVGWTPRLRAMAEALRIAQENMFIEVENGYGFVRIPAYNWGTLSVAIAEAALDQDLSLVLPQPTPRRQRDLENEYRNAPRPPTDWLT